MTPRQFKLMMQGFFTLAWILVDISHTRIASLKTMQMWTEECEKYYEENNV